MWLASISLPDLDYIMVDQFFQRMTYAVQTLNRDTWKKIVQSQRTDKRTSKIKYLTMQPLKTLKPFELTQNLPDLSGNSPQIHE